MAIPLRLVDPAPGAVQPAQNLTNAVLSQTEQMNNAVLTELNRTVSIFQATLEKSQAALKGALDKNQLLEQEIIQLNTLIKENEKSHAAEMAKNTQTITRLAGAMDTLKQEQLEQKQQFEAFVEWGNAHNHTTALNFQGGWRMSNYGSSVPTSKFELKK